MILLVLAVGAIFILSSFTLFGKKEDQPQFKAGPPKQDPGKPPTWSGATGYNNGTEDPMNEPPAPSDQDGNPLFTGQDCQDDFLQTGRAAPC